MSYRDPYAGRYQQNYAEGPEYDPYYAPTHPTYEQSGYEPYVGGYRDDLAQPSQNTLVTGHDKEATDYDHDFVAAPKPRGTASEMRRWRYEHQGDLWTKGGRGRCIGRFCFCTILIAIFLVLSIILALALWIRPPNIVIGSVQVPSTGSAIQLQSDGLTINLGVNISVNNPNYFAVSFKQIKADIFYPINNTAIGGGTENNIDFHSHSQTNFTFPFDITYKSSQDPGNKILIDLATKCGFLGGSKSNIQVEYKITLGLKIALITISPVVSNSLSFACPLQESDIAKLLPGGLGGLLSGS